MHTEITHFSTSTKWNITASKNSSWIKFQQEKDNLDTHLKILPDDIKTATDRGNH